MSDIVCPYNPEHTLSADSEPHSYYCYQCAEHYTIKRGKLCPPCLNKQLEAWDE